jgi:hypothetical protein
VTIQEDVDTLTDGGRQSNNTIDSGATVKHANEVRKVVKNRQIVLNNNDVVVGTKKATNSTGGSQTLLNIEI